MSELRKKIIAGIIIVLLLVTFFYVFYQNRKTVTQPAVKSNWYKQVQDGQWSKEIKAAIVLSKENKPNEAIKILEGVKSQMTDSGEKSIVDLTIASSILTGIDIQQGAQQYARIANTAEYPAISRAFAMIVVADRFNGLQDKNLLKPFFDEQEFTSKDSSVLISLLFQRIYDTHRFGLAAAKLAIGYINKVRQGDTISDSNYAMVTTYVTDIDKNLLELETTDAFKSYIPVTLLNKAKLFRLIESVHRPIAQSVTDIYIQAIARARIQRTIATEQFSILLYTDYLASKKERDQVIQILSILSSSTLDKMVKHFLQSPDWIKNQIPSLYKLQQDDPDFQVLYKQLIS